MLTEDQIIKRLKDGDYNAISFLMELHESYVYSLIFQMVKSRSTAEELTQDVFIKVFKKINTFQERSKITTWLYTITYRTVLNYFDKKKIVFSFTEIEKDSENTNVLEDTIKTDLQYEEGFLYSLKEKQNILWDAIDGLPDHQGLIISLHYLQQFSIIEIAELLEIPLSTVKTHLFRGRKMLREILLKKYKQDELL